jgi:hypothetical protein
MKLGLAVAATALLASGSAIGQGKMNGNEFFEGCRNAIIDNSTKNSLEQGVCIGVVWMVFKDTNWKRIGTFCRPDASNLEQAMHVAVRYMEQRPENRHWKLDALVIAAFMDAWPC